MSFRVSLRARIGALDLDLELAGGAAPLVLAGPNGSGKTSLLRIIAGAHRPDQGEVEIGGRRVFSSRLHVDVPSEGRGVGYVPQGYGLFPHLRVVDNVGFGLSHAVRGRKSRRRVALRMLGELGGGHLADRFPFQLSGGEQQRVALARALVTAPELLLLDEPFAAMDATARRSLRLVLGERLRASGIPAIVVTHDVRDALALGATVCVIERGRLVQRGSIAALRAAPASDFVAEFVGVE